MKTLARLLLVPAIALLAPQLVLADSIDPASFEAGLEIGESTTIRKTVTISEEATGAVLDVVFLIDTSGSMGAQIAAAKAAASDILAGLGGLGSLASASGYYSEPGNDGTYRALSTDIPTQQQNINDISLLLGGGGGDFPEEGIAATFDAATNTAWRPGSNRFIIAFGDATFKESDGITTAAALAALADNNVTFLGLDFGNMTRSDFGGIDPTILADATGGTIFPTATDPDAIVAAIIALVTDVLAEYTEVTVSDLGAGLPGVGVSVACVSADTGACAGDTALGTYDRSVERTFEFDVTFTGLAEGTHSFETHALVDGGIVASEADRIRIGEGAVAVPEPGTLALLGAGLLGIGLMRRRRNRA